MRCLLAFLKKDFHSAQIYRIDFLLKIIYGVIAMYGFRCLWISLYAQETFANESGRTLSAMITYALLSVSIDMILNPFEVSSSPHQYTALQIRTGRITSDLLRPVNFQLQLLLRNMSAALLGICTLVLPMWVLSFCVFGMQAPASVFYGLAFLLSMACSYLISFSLNFLLGLICFITLDIRNITFAYVGIMSVLSGQVIPIDLFPNVLRVICKCMPFYYIYGAPLNLYTGVLPDWAALATIGMQMLWSVLLLLTGQLIWRNLHKRLIVQGG